MPRPADPALPARRRAQILDAAKRCFLERGFRQTTIEEICAEAGVSPGALYRYFDSKAEIVAAIARDARSDAEAALERLNGAEALLEGLADLARSFFETFNHERGGALLAEIWAEAARDERLAEALRASDRVAAARLEAAIQRAQRQGAIYAALAPAEAAETLMAALEGAALRRAMRGEREVGDAVRRFRSLALHLLKPKR